MYVLFNFIEYYLIADHPNYILHPQIRRAVNKLDMSVRSKIKENSHHSIYIMVKYKNSKIDFKRSTKTTSMIHIFTATVYLQNKTEF